MNFDLAVTSAAISIWRRPDHLGEQGHDWTMQSTLPMTPSFDRDPDRCRHAGLEQKIRIGRTDDDVVGRDVLICLRRWPNLRHRARTRTVRKGLNGERSFVTDLDLAAVLRADNGVDVSEGEIFGDDEERRRFV